MLELLTIHHQPDQRPPRTGEILLKHAKPFVVLSQQALEPLLLCLVLSQLTLEHGAIMLPR